MVGLTSELSSILSVSGPVVHICREIRWEGKGKIRGEKEKRRKKRGQGGEQEKKGGEMVMKVRIQKGYLQP